MKKLSIAMVCAQTALAACHLPDRGVSDADAAAPPAGPTSGATTLASAPPPAVPVAAATAATDASNTFGFDLYRRVRPAATENIAISPASISLALSMTAAGARGRTQREMHAVLHFPADEIALHRGWAAQTKRWQVSKDVEIAVANRLFGQEGYAFEAPFLALNEQHYGAPLEQVDFAGASEEQRLLINGWVADRTSRRILDLIPSGGIDGSTRLVLTNAMYFNAVWATPFDAELTQPAPFTGADDQVRYVEMMQRIGDMPYAEVGGVRVAELGYRGGQFAAMFVLPDDPQGLDAVEAKLSPELIAKWSDSLETQSVNIKLPRFKLEASDSLRLSGPLAALGMPSAFGSADFSGISHGGDLSIDEVYHKAFVEMHEKGTEAAAATAVVMKESAVIAPTGGKLFALDRPFLFFLRDVETGLIMFTGRVAKI